MSSVCHNQSNPVWSSVQISCSYTSKFNLQSLFDTGLATCQTASLFPLFSCLVLAKAWDEVQLSEVMEVRGQQPIDGIDAYM